MKQTQLQEDVFNYALRLGDDSLILGHRISEWASKGPFLEEDIALGNVALDYLGRARMYYDYASHLSVDDKTEDDFAFLRGERDFKNYLLNELPKGDFAYTMVRQLFIDVYNSLYLPLLKNSTDKNLAAIAAKAEKETLYHLRRSRDWTIRLGDGTEESHNRMVKALSEMFGYTNELFEPDALELRLIEQGVAVDTSALKTQWLDIISSILDEATLAVPENDWAVRGGREGYHTEHLGHLLTVMQSVHRAYPGCEW